MSEARAKLLAQGKAQVHGRTVTPTRVSHSVSWLYSGSTLLRPALCTLLLDVATFEPTVFFFVLIPRPHCVAPAA